MSDTSTSERALRLAWRQASFTVARSLAALCYDKVAGAAEAEALSRRISAAVKHRREVEVRLRTHRNPQAVPSLTDAASPGGSMEQMVQATGETRALRPPKETPPVATAWHRLSTS